MTELGNIVWGSAPIVLSAIAVIVAVEAFRAAHAAQSHVNELEALISRHRRADTNAAARLRSPEVG